MIRLVATLSRGPAGVPLEPDRIIKKVWRA
jgi:hypothetical protein